MAEDKRPLFLQGVINKAIPWRERMEIYERQIKVLQEIGEELRKEDIASHDSMV